MQDLHNHIEGWSLVAPQSIASGGSAQGAAIDLSGYTAVDLHVHTGDNGAGVVPVTIEGSYDGTTWEAVEAAYIDGDTSDVPANTLRRLGFGYATSRTNALPHRHLRVTVDASGAACEVGVAAVLSKTRNIPA